MCRVVVVGGGLAGCEAAWAAANRGAEVTLFEMRPTKMTPAHRTDLLAELVCSNSLKSTALTSAHGLLKAEMRRLGSLVLACAVETAVPAGEALAVDVVRFAGLVTKCIEGHPRITVVREEAVALPEAPAVVVATGPLTSDALSAELARLAGEEHLYFFDAIAPTVDGETIDRSRVFAGSRYSKGDPGYLNCPLTEQEYHAFREQLLKAERVNPRDFEPSHLFEGCLPIEELAARSPMSMAFGPMKPVGLVDPRTGRRPFAVVQLRQENAEATAYGLVGFQTRLKYAEQKRVFRMIPGLEHAEFLRYGQMHRNTYVNSPRLLLPSLEVRPEVLDVGRKGSVLLSGQIVGVEGYAESAATGIIAGINAVRALKGQAPFLPPPETMIGALLHYVAGQAHPTLYPGKRFQPMNSNFGLLPPLGVRMGKRERYLAMSQRALQALDAYLAWTGESGLSPLKVC
ncbi:MAG: methylenetetrahydrofolate--tRNA-(uracil(54)-C(5))-methyltransferase (FADH(2)-oxidizing) TrmFO [Armatimonadota bacterium]